MKFIFSIFHTWDDWDVMLPIEELFHIFQDAELLHHQL